MQVSNTRIPPEALGDRDNSPQEHLSVNHFSVNSLSLFVLAKMIIMI